jgi:hypothetical protein
MMSQLSILILAATLGQVPAESGWLNSVPPDADVVLRVRGLVAAKGDLVAMLKAMSPALAEQAEPALEQGVATAKAQIGEPLVTEPFFILLRGVPPEGQGPPPFAVMVKSSNYEALLKSVSGGKDPEIKHLAAGYDSFNGPDGETWYAAKGDGTIAFGGDKTLIGGCSKPGSKALGKTLSPGLQRKFLAGDVGVYVNVDILATRYAEPIARAEQALLATFDTIGPQVGAGMVESIKSIYRKMFESIKEADGFALSVDFSGEGLDVSGALTLKADSKAVKEIARIQTSPADQLAKLPVDSSYYIYMNLNADLFRSLQMMSLQMLSPGGKASPELEATIAKERGQIETISSMSIGDGIKSFQVSTLSDPKSFVTAYEGMMKLMQRADSPFNFFKEIKTTPNAETLKGFSFTRIEMTLDYDKFAKLQPNNPAAVATLKAMYGGDKITTWLGVGDTQMIQVSAPSWADAKSQIDGYFKGDGSIGATTGFKATRARLPKEASVLGLMSAQGFVRQLTAQFSTMAPNALKQPPADMPKEPVFLGFSLAPKAPNSLEFQMFVPSAVGPVIEKGLVPVVSSLRPPGNP